MNMINPTHSSAVNSASPLWDYSNVAPIACESMLEPHYEAGRAAYAAGKAEYANPNTGGTLAWSAWQLGWEDANGSGQ